MNTNLPVTIAFDAHTFADGFRRQCLCLPFYELRLIGPEGSYEAKGILVSRGDRLFIEYSPIPFDGSTVPKTRGSGQFGPDDFWKAQGVTIHGLHVYAEDLLPPSQGWTSTNGHIHYASKVPRVRVSENPIVEASQDILPAANRIWQRASLGGVKLELQNESQVHEERNPFFEGLTYRSWSEGTWIGDLQGWRFCFRSEGDDVFLHLETQSEYDATSDVKSKNRLAGILNSFAFMQAGAVIPWRVQHSVDRLSLPDVFLPHFKHSFNHASPIGGPMLYKPDFVMSMFVRMADYFAEESAHASQMQRFLWQLNNAKHGREINLHSSMHLCAIFEGMCNQVLAVRFGWSKTQLRKPALVKFRNLADGLSLIWEGQFERIVKIWKSLRDDLAHGNFFGVGGAWDGDLFTLNSLVTGGIQAIYLKDAEWPEPIDFRLLGQTSHLYYQ